MNPAVGPGNIFRAGKVAEFCRVISHRYPATGKSGGADALIDRNCAKPDSRNRIV